MAETKKATLVVRCIERLTTNHGESYKLTSVDFAPGVISGILRVDFGVGDPYEWTQRHELAVGGTYVVALVPVHASYDPRLEAEEQCCDAALDEGRSEPESK